MINRLLGMPQNASEHGLLIDQMLEFCHWFMLTLFVGWSLFFLFTLFRFHKSRHPKADYHGVKTKVSTHIEFGVVLIEAVLLLGFALPLWGKRVNEFPKEDALNVRVIGQQFIWLFHYQGPDGIFGKQDASLITSSNQLGLDYNDPAGRDDIVSTNELHLPQNRPVILQISSKDVIHSLSLQHMRIGQDAIPGLEVPMWFRPVRAGNYEIICGQLCGLSHYNMRANMIVESQEEFDGWLKDMAQLSAVTQPGTVPGETGKTGTTAPPESGAASVPVPGGTNASENLQPAGPAPASSPASAPGGPNPPVHK
jgi:cytochrome c oxidase subunit II